MDKYGKETKVHEIVVDIVVASHGAYSVLEERINKKVIERQEEEWHLKDIKYQNEDNDGYISALLIWEDYSDI